MAMLVAAGAIVATLDVGTCSTHARFDDLNSRFDDLNRQLGDLRADIRELLEATNADVTP